ncbi:MAG: hypothetical protein NVS3B20_23390 [Polyangiales bacterium]
MAEERKKVTIDLKSRIPSKTVKGLTPVPGGAIPPPPGAVPAPPPDLLGRRSLPPKVSADPNDPLGAAHIEGGNRPQQQVIVVEAAHHEGVGAASKKGVLYGIIVAVLAVGAGLGFAIGSATARSAVASKAKTDATELSQKIAKSNEALGKFVESLKGGLSEIDQKGFIEPATIEAIKGYTSPLNVGDLKSREIAYFGETVSGKLLTYAQRVAYIDELKASLTKSNGLENTSAQMKQLAIPKGQVKYGVQISKQGGGPNDPQITSATVIDFGTPIDLKTNLDSKADKLKFAKGDPVDVYPGKGDFLDKGYVSVIDSKDWLKACPVYGQVVGYAKQGLQEIVVAVEGQGDDRGALQPGKELADQLKNLAK